MAKNNARTFRYSDEVAAILQQHNNDFDALVLECFYKLPEVRKEIEVLEAHRLSLRHECQELIELKQLKYDINRAEISLQGLLNRIDSRG